MIMHRLPSTRPTKRVARTTTKGKTTMGRRNASLDEDDDEDRDLDLETYCISFISFSPKILTLETFPPSSFSSSLTLDPQPRPIQISPLPSLMSHASRSAGQPSLGSPLPRGKLFDSPSSPGPLSYEPVKGMAPLKRKRTHEQPDDMKTPSGQEKEHHS